MNNSELNGQYSRIESTTKFKGDIISGIPAKDHKKRIKQEAIINRLPNIMKDIKK